nr:NFX1-type zinc finger-containing protein 1-like [Leptinotarsa decemlineata]
MNTNRFSTKKYSRHSKNESRRGQGDHPRTLSRPRDRSSRSHNGRSVSPPNGHHSRSRSRDRRPHSVNELNTRKRPYEDLRLLLDGPHNPKRPNKDLVDDPHNPKRPYEDLRLLLDRPHNPKRPNKDLRLNVDDPHNPKRPNKDLRLFVNGPHNPKKMRQMGFRSVQDLLMKENLEDIILVLSNDKNGFKEVLENREMSNDMVVLILRLLSKISECSFQSSKIELLEFALRSAFADNVIKFVSTIAIQTSQEKNRNTEFWKDTDQFWNNMIQVTRNMQDIIPTSSCEVTLKLLKAAKLNIPNIETSHTLKISDSIKKEVDQLFDIAEKLSMEIEQKTKVFTVGANMLEPPNNFREISVYPSAVEVTQPKAPFLRPNVIEGPYRDVEHYLDVQFRLLREDFVAPLRGAICRYLKNPKAKLDDVRIYKGVQFLNAETVTEQKCFRIQYDFSTKKRIFQYENSRRFMFGALLCFTSDNFKTVLFAKVAKRDVKDLLENGQLFVGFSEDVDLPENMYDLRYIMVESTVYFEPYYQVLNVLKTMKQENFPMERYIIRVKTNIRPPHYLLRKRDELYMIEDQSFCPLEWGERKFYGFNESQDAAFQAALTKDFCVIQGPPGTGKTFLGLKIVHTLLRNMHIWFKNTPILVICFTNHALDQFLEGILPVTENILRVGGQSKNEKLYNYNIRKKRIHLNYNSVVSQKRHRVQSSINEISTITEYLSEIEKNTSVVTFEVFRDIVPGYSGSWFDAASGDDIVRWLLSGGKYSYRNGRKKRQRNRKQQKVDPTPQTNEPAVIDKEEKDVNGDVNEIVVDQIFENIKVEPFRKLIDLESMVDRQKSMLREVQVLENEPHLKNRDCGRDILTFELYKIESEIEYLKMRLGERVNSNSPPEFVDLANPHNMSSKDRWKLYYQWLDIYVAKLRARKEEVNRSFRKLYSVYSEMRDMEDAKIMKSSLVVGMTTTGAARLQSSLQSLKSPIVIVEEAAEVLEAHIISSLTPHCRHLILIGDHQQLKPTTANFKIETKYGLGISLFERMINNKIQCHTLTVQHRMRPEISCLIRPAIYPVLEDHISVSNRPQTLGVEKCLYFLDHQEQEDICKDNSKRNVHESKFLIRLARHLVLNGYNPTKITILVAYLGQMFEMQREKRQYSNLLQGIRIAVLDNYQGEENDIILLSLVRNNSENKIGFLKIENRVCVALSRARNGLYIMGNMNLLCNNSKIWPKIREALESQNAIGHNLMLRCQVHYDKITPVKKADDFNSFPEGGCSQICGAKLGCGHFCKRLCHVEDKEHVLHKCREKCSNVLCEDPTHICRELCFKECGPCKYLVNRKLQCGHLVEITCHSDPTVYECKEDVYTKLPCGHEAKKPCHINPELFRCPYPCDSRVEPCGHSCTRGCHITDDPDHLKYKCMKPCDRYRKGCTNQTDEAHLCRRMCCEECPECEVEVLKKKRKCNHSFKIACKQDVDLIPCRKPCLKILPCGHKCTKRCEASCGNCRKMVEKIVSDCNHTIKIECSVEPEKKFCKSKCPRVLPCGHECPNRCDEDCTTNCKVMIDCSIPSPCGHIVKRIECFLKDSEDQKIRVNFCTEPCGVKLKCNHICQGTCGECSQGRIHVKCKEKCGVPLVCNHECPIPCREACKPCRRPCEYRCKHSKCKRNCGDPCTVCKESCPRKCEHQKCSRKCGYMCDVPPCNKPCKKKLKCGHRCIGFCGDPCPILCKVCDRDELTHIFLGNEDEEDAIYVMLEDCKHIFESDDIENWLMMGEDEIKAKVCPRCKTTIKTTTRYSNYIRRTLEDITMVKTKFYGDPDENEGVSYELIAELQNLLEKVSWIKIEKKDLRVAINHLLLRLERTRNMRYQPINKMDLQAIKAKWQIFKAVVKIFYDLQLEFKETVFHSCEEQLSFIVGAVMRDEDSITGQEIEDITLEINRLKRRSQFEQIKTSSTFSTYVTKDDVQQQVTKISDLLNSLLRYSSDLDDTLQSELEKLKELTASPIQISEAERIAIVKAIGLSPGHWYKCPNGHPYLITECGGAMQVSKCNDCGVDIGGRNHRLLPGQEVATEMDGALHGAWSEAANMENYAL